MEIAVLAVQGAFREHRQCLTALGVTSREIRQKADLQPPFDGLILPGGESTVMLKLLHQLELFEPLKQLITEGLPVFGTCAGMILLARQLTNDSRVGFGTMDITVTRNAYGRQLGSFIAQGEFADQGSLPLVFIRAPYLQRVGAEVQILTSLDGQAVAVREGQMLATAFHPELNQNTYKIHQYFLNMCRETAFFA